MGKRKATKTLSDYYAFLTQFQLSFVGGEIKDLEATLPKILRTAMAFIIMLFLASNFALYVTVPAEKLKEINAPALVS